MNKPRSLLIAAAGLLFCCRPLSAGRPLTIDDAEPVAHRQFEWEAGVGYVGGSGLRHFDFPFTLVYGLMPRWEVGIGFGGQVEEREKEFGQHKAVTDIGDLSLGTKIKMLTADRFWADQSLSLTVKLPTASYHRGMGSGRADFDAMWIVSKPLGEKWNLHLNVGHTWTGNRSEEAFDDVLHYGVALDYRVSTKCQIVTEVFADTPLTADRDTAVQARGGLRWLVGGMLVLDLAAGMGLRRPAPDVTATIGLTWTFGPDK